mgnify:CR=1 FL=1
MIHEFKKFVYLDGASTAPVNKAEQAEHFLVINISCGNSQDLTNERLKVFVVETPTIIVGVVK